nr:ABC transporter substrate-binding protein [Marinicella sp. W31]MDC2879769.1 ABC transporter substrate-binding protein [Marinicella sp. W31]
MTMKLTILAGLMAATSMTAANAADLRMSWWGGDSRHLATQEALKYCGDKLGHTISPEFTGWTGHQEKITTQLAGRTEADIMQINWPWLPLFTPNGEGFADLNDFSDIIDLSQWTDGELATSTVNGHLQGLPLSITGRLPWFNQTTFEKAGLSVPTTWVELEEAGKVFKEKLGDDYYPYEATGTDGLDARLLMTAYLTQKTGKTMIDPETLEFNYSMEELVDALEMYKRYTDEGVIIPGRKSPPAAIWFCMKTRTGLMAISLAPISGIRSISRSPTRCRKARFWFPLRFFWPKARPMTVSTASRPCCSRSRAIPTMGTRPPKWSIAC